MKRKLTLILIWAFCQITLAQNKNHFSFQDLTVENGLSQNSVISIAQDSTGYLWLATQDGLNRYSGKEFTHYKKQFEDITRPTYSRLGKVYVDRQKQLWIVTNSGNLELYQQKSDDFKAIPNFQEVSTVFQTKNLDFYIGTYNNRLYKISAKTKDTVQLFNSKDKQLTVYDFLEFQDSLWVACSGKVVVFNAQKAYSEIKVQGATKANFSTLERTSDHTMWLGSYGQGLFFKSDNSNKFLPFEHSKIPSNLNVEDLLVDSENRLWIATYGKGVFLYNPKDNSVLNFTENQNDPFAIHYNDLLSLYEDNSGVIWIGSDGAGANYFDNYHIKFNILTNNQLPKNTTVDVIRSIATDQNNNLWLGTSGKGLTKVNFKNNSSITYTPQNSALPSGRIISLNFDGTDLWIGHQGFGLNVGTPPNNLKNYSEISTYTIWKIVQKSNTQSWLCTESNGLVLFDKNKGVQEQFNTQNSNLTTNDIRTIEKGSNGIWWVGSDDKGLFKLNTQTKQITNIKIIPNKIKSLYFDGELLWVGTNGNGLKKYNPKTGRVNHFSIEQGLLNDVVYGILPDNGGNLWLSSNKGISQFNPTNLKFTNYNNPIYLQSYEFNTGAYYKDQQGNLYFGGLNGLNWFKPENLKTNPIQPKTVITKMEVFNKEKPLHDRLHLQHNKNTVSFTFASLQFSQPEENQYKYRLIGNDTEWINSGNQNKARYTNLEPGKYEFQVLSSNYDGVWGENPATYSFTILKPWYATHLAIVFFGLLFLLCMYLLYYYFKWRWNVKNELKQERNESLRLKKNDELKTKLYANISHEFRTPLSLISGPIENQLNRDILTEKDKKELDLVKHNTDRLLELINQMMDLSLLDSGQKELNLIQGNLNVLLTQLIEAFQYRAKSKKITIQTRVQGLYNCWFDRDIIEKTLSNLLSNAIKYTPERSTIQLNAIENNRMFIFTVINETEQLDNTNLSKLFQRFYKNNETSEGVGIGLALVKELVQLAQGTIAVNTLEDTKIQFTVSLPIEQSFFIEYSIENTGLLEEVDIDFPHKNTIEKEKETKNKTIKNKLQTKGLPQVLIVEDSPDMRAFIVSNFENDYKVLEADNGKPGIDLAQKHLPDLIISDVMMPIKTGFELCDEIKQNTLTSHIPVILLTAKVGEENEIQGFKTGADAYITKPFSTEKLKIRTKQLIDAQKRLAEHYNNTFSINPDLAITDTEADFLERLKNVLNEHITDDGFNNEVFGRLMQMSERQLHRKLKAVIGMTPTEFVRNERVKLAAELLKKSDATVSEIAYQVGFNTSSYFIKCFKKIYGCTPSEFSENS